MPQTNNAQHATLEAKIEKQREDIMQILYRTGSWSRLSLIYIVRGIGYGVGALIFWGLLFLVIILWP